MNNYEKFQQLIKQGTVVKYDECSKKEYYVGKSGKLYSVNKETHKIGQPKKTTNKFNYEFIYIRATKKKERVHRLVAKYFVENKNPETANCIDHINGIKNDNRAENLRWVSNSDNVSLAWQSGQHINTKRKLRDRLSDDSSFMYEDDLINKFRGGRDEELERLRQQEEAYDNYSDNHEYLTDEEFEDLWEEKDELLEMTRKCKEEANKKRWYDTDYGLIEEEENKYKDHYNG